MIQQQMQQRPVPAQNVSMDPAAQIQQADALRKEMYRQQVDQQQQQLFQANTQRQQFAIQAQAQRHFLQQQQQQLQHPPQGQAQYFGIGGGLVQHQGSSLDATPVGGIQVGQVGAGRPHGAAAPVPLGNTGFRAGLKAGSKYSQYQTVGVKALNEQQAHAAAQAQAAAQANGENPQDALLRELFPGWFP